MSIELIIAVVVILGLIFYLISIYNKLISLKNRVDNGWAQIDVQLQRRYDLIPNLVETAKGYMKHEKETLKLVIDARNSANPSATSEMVKRAVDEALSARIPGIVQTSAQIAHRKTVDNWQRRGSRFE